MMNRLDSVSNEKIKLAVKIAASSKARKETGLFFLEGLRLCRDSALTGTVIRYAFVTDKSYEKFGDDAEFICSKANEAYLISETVADKLSLTQTPQGFFCLCEKCSSLSLSSVDSEGKYIALENIQDPANLGAICRTAEALGITGAILCGCCDRYSPKSQRAAMGSLLRLPVLESDDLCRDIELLKEKGMAVYATSPDSSAEKITEIPMDGGIVCVIGNEGNGVSDEVFSLCRKVTIPMKGNAESLNASMAAAITMWEMMK
ncbi:MAG: RNA methyltransferase [Clostridia bacterium]|nr:RNA methyltransferase [Clostridia bacterium]